MSCRVLIANSRFFQFSIEKSHVFPAIHVTSPLFTTSIERDDEHEVKQGVTIVYHWIFPDWYVDESVVQWSWAVWNNSKMTCQEFIEKIGSIHFMGHSLGGMLLWRFTAILRPQNHDEGQRCWWNVSIDTITRNHILTQMRSMVLIYESQHLPNRNHAVL